MMKKQLFYFALGLNFLFYGALAFSFYWYQEKYKNYELSQQFVRTGRLIEQEMADRKEFYNQWFKDFSALTPATSPLFYKTYRINYVGRFEGEELKPFPPFTQKPPFSPEVLKDNKLYLFYRDGARLFFTYTMADQNSQPVIVVHEEDGSYFLRRLEKAQTHVAIFERGSDGIPLTLYSNLKADHTKILFEKYSQLKPLEYENFNQESFYVFQIPLFYSEKYKQDMFLVFNRNIYFFDSPIAVTIGLLALLGITCFGLFAGYVYGRERI